MTRLASITLATLVTLVVGAAVVLALPAKSPTAGDRPAGDRPGGDRSGGDPVVAAAGDIACDPDEPVTPTTCQHEAVSDKILSDPAIDNVFLLGDNQYDNGTAEDYADSYDPTWGRFKAITKPVPGNHEYRSREGAVGYFAYFGSLAGDPSKGYYSFDIGEWHFVALNSQIDHKRDGAQVAWLESDLAAHPNKCVGAIWHHPRWSGGVEHGDSLRTAPFWKALHDADADLVLNGHDHDYERFHPLDLSGERDDARGITQIVSGLGGKEHNPVNPRDITAAHNSSSFGYTRLVLHPTSADISFVSAVGSYSDETTLECH
jgi:acid phosphatase type 7